MRRLILGLTTHSAALGVGFSLGIYMLPILSAPRVPDALMLENNAKGALFMVELTRDLRGSGFPHCGEGAISITSTQFVHEGSLAPGPDYKLYLVKQFVDHEDQFLLFKSETS